MYGGSAWHRYSAFVPQSTDRARAVARAPAYAAEVIIFPGIRYERWDEAHAVTQRER